MATAKRHRKIKGRGSFSFRSVPGSKWINMGKGPHAPYAPIGGQPKPISKEPTLPTPGDIAGGAATASAQGFKHVLIEPVIGDFKKNRGKIVIGLVAGIILLGAGFKSINSLTGGAVSGVATAAVAPEVEGLSVIRQGVKAGARARLSSAKTRLHAREPIRPVRYGMRKTNP